MRLLQIDKKDNGQKIIAENLSILLKKNNLSASQLAHLIDLPMMTIRRLLSGETEDPRISTLKMIADHFEVPIDLLINTNPNNQLISTKKTKSHLIPKINWETLSSLITSDDFHYNNWNNWQSISLNNDDFIGPKAFALESRPSMYPRFPKGTIFIIDPSTLPADGDIVLIKIKNNSEFTLRELIIDPPDWRLSPLISDSNTIILSTDEHEIIGVNLLMMLYNPKLNG